MTSITNHTLGPLVDVVGSEIRTETFNSSLIWLWLDLKTHMLNYNGFWLLKLSQLIALNIKISQKRSDKSFISWGAWGGPTFILVKQSQQDKSWDPVCLGLKLQSYLGNHDIFEEDHHENFNSVVRFEEELTNIRYQGWVNKCWNIDHDEPTSDFYNFIKTCLLTWGLRLVFCSGMQIIIKIIFMLF